MRCSTLDELCERSDCILILAPSNPEKHLQYARQVLKYRKRTYIDKTFAPDCKTAERIFSIGSECHTPFFSTSALRYASELDALKGNVEKAIITGGGRSFEEYLIHMVEMAVVLFPQAAFDRVKSERIGAQRLIRMQCADGKEAALIYSPSYGYTIAAEFPGGKTSFVSVTSAFFLDLIKSILRFFETGAHPFEPRETLEVMRVRDAILLSEKQPDEWLAL